MTIVVNIAVPEGIVFATDSRQTYTNARGDVRVSSDYAQKLFQIGPNIAAATYGWAFLMNRNIHSHLNDFKISLGDQILSVEEIAKRLGQYLTEQYKQDIDKGLDKPVDEKNYALALLVGGYDTGDKTGKVFEVYVPNGEYYLVRNTDDKVGAGWRGQVGPIGRLLKGFDMRLKEVKGYTPELEASLAEAPLDYLVDYWSMPLQDAVDFATFLVHTTIQIQRFSDGLRMSPGASANCGGPIEIAVLLPSRGIQWIQHKELQGERASAVVLNSET